MRLLICGDRNWTDLLPVERCMRELSPEVVIHGCARGADSLAGKAAKMLGIPVEEFPAQWDEYQKKYPTERFGMKWKLAGTDRNQQMLDEGKPDYVLVFHDNIQRSKGTADMLRRAKAAGIKTELWQHKPVSKTAV